MAPGYVIAQVRMAEAEAQSSNKAIVQVIMEKFGGEFPVRGGAGESHEGRPHCDRHVVFRFPNYPAAKDWYRARYYAETKALQMSASSSVQANVKELE